MVKREIYCSRPTLSRRIYIEKGEDKLKINKSIVKWEKSDVEKRKFCLNDVYDTIANSHILVLNLYRVFTPFTLIEFMK